MANKIIIRSRDEANKSAKKTTMFIKIYTAGASDVYKTIATNKE